MMSPQPHYSNSTDAQPIDGVGLLVEVCCKLNRSNAAMATVSVVLLPVVDMPEMVNASEVLAPFFRIVKVLVSEPLSGAFSSATNRFLRVPILVIKA